MRKVMINYLCNRLQFRSHPERQSIPVQGKHGHESDFIRVSGVEWCSSVKQMSPSL